MKDVKREITLEEMEALPMKRKKSSVSTIAMVGLLLYVGGCALAIILKFFNIG